MSVKTGRLGWVGIALETTAGVPVNPADYVPFLESSLDVRMTPLPDVAARGIRDEQSENSQLGKNWGEGSLRVNLDPSLSGYLLGMAMGTFGSPVSEGSGVYTHTMTRNNTNAPKTASIIFDRVQDRQLFPYAVINSLEATFEDGLAELNASILSRAPVASVSGSITTTSGTLFAFRHAQIQFGADVPTAIASSTFIPLRSFNVTINNNAEAQFVAGNRNADSIISKNFNVSGTFRLAFENNTQRDAFNALTKQAMVVTFTGGGIGGGMYEFVKFRFYKIRFENYSVSVPNDDYVSEEISFVAEYDSTNTTTLDVQLRNRKSSY